MKKIIFAVFKPKFNLSFLKQTNKSLYFSKTINAYFSTIIPPKEDVKVDAQDSHDDFKPKIKPANDYEALYPEIEKVLFLYQKLINFLFNFRL